VRELHRYLAWPNRVLDIGCGTGELLDVIRATGNNQIMGIEPSGQAAEIARKDRNLKVKTGTLEQVNLPSASIDTVLLSHVLEHLPSPRSTMSEVRRVLKPGGVVIIWVPNAASIPACVLGRYWMGWDVPRHLYAFTPGSLHRLMDAVELEPGEILHERHGLEWSWGLRLWIEKRYPASRINDLLAILHPVTSVAMTPVGVISAALGQSGRIRMIARKPLE
jgi:SAM-dependent methyltransferase